MPSTRVDLSLTGSKRLEEYFTVGLDQSHVDLVGMEVETSFLSEDDLPITLRQSQQIFLRLAEQGWNVNVTKFGLFNVATDQSGNTLRYDVGRQNLEIAMFATSRQKIIPQCHAVLEKLYDVASLCGAYPSHQPVLDAQEDLLVVTSEFDAMRVTADGYDARNTLAKISSVQFTLNIPVREAIPCLNRLGVAVSRYLEDYPQDRLWRTYIRESHARYRHDRYGGPLQFVDIAHYCAELAKHDVVQGDKLVPCDKVANMDVTSHLRLIWWHFRLRRYDDRLCIEVRPLARRGDDCFRRQLYLVLDTLAL